MRQVITVSSEARMRALGRLLAAQLKAGDLLLLEGELGAGKTTLARGVLEGLGHVGSVRSPTFNLIQTFATSPPVMHADLYRVNRPQEPHDGLGLEDYLDTHVCLIEWPDRAPELGASDHAITVRIDFDGDGRVVTLATPRGPTLRLQSEGS